MSVRVATHAGTWYPSDPIELRRVLDGYLASVSNISPNTPLRAIVAPHAGYRYSGQTAAWAYRSINSSTVRRIFVIGPCHHVYLEGCALPEASVARYSTPLGDFELDVEVIQQLKSQASFKTFKLEDDQEEHSIEMQLPILRHVVPGPVKLVPIYVGSIGQSEEAVFGQYLFRFFDDPSNLFVISSDFCHWGHRFRYTPSSVPSVPVNEQIETLDRIGIDLIVAQDSQGFYKYCQSTGNTICGRTPILILLETLRQAKTKCGVTFVHYSQSGLLPVVPSKSDSCVSYAAGLVYVMN